MIEFEIDGSFECDVCGECGGWKVEGDGYVLCLKHWTSLKKSLTN